MGLLKTLVFIFSISSISYLIRWHYIGRIYQSRRKFRNRDIIVITGATSGIGLAIVNSLARSNCHLVIGCRDKTSGEKVKEQLNRKFGGDTLIDVLNVDLRSLKSVKDFAIAVNKLNKPIYALINNAGIFYAPPSLTNDGVDQTFQVNYLSHYLLTILLLPRLKQHPNGARVVNVVSQAHRRIHHFPILELHRNYIDSAENRFKAYEYSKFCLVLFSYKLSTILNDSSLSIHCVDPGNVETNIFRNFPQLSNKFLFYLQKPIRTFIIKTPYEGAQGILYTILSKQRPRFYIRNFFSTDECDYKVNPLVFNPILGDTLWKWSRTSCQKYLIEMS